MNKEIVNYFKKYLLDSKRGLTISLVLILLILGVFMISFLNSSESSYKAWDSLEDYAKQMVDACIDKNGKEACYLKETIELMKVASLEEAFDVIRIAQEQDDWLLACHTIGHVIGEKEVEKDPANWAKVVGRCPDFTCSDGCPHGAIVAKFGARKLTKKDTEQAKEDLASACGYDGIEENLTPRMYKCIHGVGHLIMFLTEANIEESLEVCANVTGAESSAYGACSEGVFMIMHQPLGPDQEDLVAGIAPTLETLDDFCSGYTGITLQSCYNEAFPLLGGDALDHSKVEDFCTYSEDQFVQDRCLEVFHMVAAKVLLVSEIRQIDDFAEYCNDASSKRIAENCIRHGAIKVLQQDPSLLNVTLKICEQSEALGLGDVCLYEVSVYFPTTYLVDNEPALKEYCKGLPSPWDQTCLKTKDSWDGRSRELYQN